MQPFVRILSLCLSIALSSAAIAEDGAHQHAPIIVRSRPVIERIPLKVIEPVDIITTRYEETLVADVVGQVIFRIDSTGNSSVLANQLDNLSRVAAHRTGIFALQATRGSGQIVQLTESGLQSEPVMLKFSPVGLVLDDEGTLWTGIRNKREIFRLFSDNVQSRQRISEPVKDLVLNSKNTPVALLQSGKVVELHPFGDSVREIKIGYVPTSSKRLCFHPEDGVLALGSVEAFKTAVFRLSATPDSVRRFGSVPEGTSAITFDRLGNLTSANPDLRALTKVTSHFEIPCPHCDQKVRMTLSPNVPEQPKRRSF